MKKVKARKNHVCIYCKNAITKGEYYLFESSRFPKTDVRGFQIGIEYHQDKMCMSCHSKFEKERIDFELKQKTCNHEFIEDSVLDDYVGNQPVFLPNGKFICKKCGFEKKESENT